MPEIKIRDLRLTAIWAETQLDLLDRPAPAGAPYAFLGRNYDYEDQIAALLAGHAAPGGLALPWRDLDQNYFWKYCLQVREAKDLQPHKVWRALVPLRGRIPLQIEALWLPSSSYLFWAAYYYPHGIAFALTAVLRGKLTLDQAVAAAYDVMRNECYRVQAGGGAVEPLTLDELAGKGLSIARANAIGPGARPGARPGRPFTVATVVRADGVPPDAETPNGGAVHRALEALTTWQHDYAHVVLPELRTVRLGTRNAPAGHVLYRHRRGRAVWFPASFDRPGSGQHSLACYHRNLVMASLQVESLGGLIAETARCLAEAPARFIRLGPCARCAAGSLGRLYGGRNTYRSWSPRAQIEQNEWVPALELVRAQYANMGPLS